MKQRFTFKKGDFAAIGAVLLAAFLLAAGLWLRAGRADRVMLQVYRNGTLIKEISLEQDTTFTIEGEYQNVITVQDGRVAITAADCPGNDCVHSGSISSAGQVLVCLPNRVELRLTGAAEVDITVR